MKADEEQGGPQLRTAIARLNGAQRAVAWDEHGGRPSWSGRPATPVRSGWRVRMTAGPHRLRREPMTRTGALPNADWKRSASPWRT
jgi:hypothetical protein